MTYAAGTYAVMFPYLNYSTFHTSLDLELFRVTTTGQLASPTPTPLTAVSDGSQASLQDVATDGSSVAVLWIDGLRNQSGAACIQSAQLYVTLLSESGQLTGPVSVAPLQLDCSSRAAIGFDGTNYLITVGDSRNSARPTQTDVWGTRMTPAGSFLDPSGFQVTNAGAAQMNPTMAFDGTNYLVVWEDSRDSGNSARDLYATRVRPDGTVLDGPGGFAIASGPADQWHASVAFDGSSFLVTWQEGADTSPTILTTRVTSAGTMPDPSVIVANEANLNLHPTLASDGQGHAVVVYENLTRDTVLHARSLNDDGVPVDAGPGDSGGGGGSTDAGAGPDAVADATPDQLAQGDDASGTTTDAGNDVIDTTVVDAGGGDVTNDDVANPPSDDGGGVPSPESGPGPDGSVDTDGSLNDDGSVSADGSLVADGSPNADGSVNTDGSVGAGGDLDAAEDSSGDGASPDAQPVAYSPPGQTDDSSCSLAAGPSHGSGGPVLLALAALALRRRRRGGVRQAA